MKTDLARRTLAEIRTMISESDDLDLMRTGYTFQLGRTFIQICGMESHVISTMMICDLILVGKALGPDLENWQKIIAKQKMFQESTLGSLIKILEKHNILSRDLEYLRWVKSQRDFFIHRFYHNGGWPGELVDLDCAIMMRRLRYLELIFWRAERTIWRIFIRADLMDAEDLGAAGVVLMNKGCFDFSHNALSS